MSLALSLIANRRVDLLARRVDASDSAVAGLRGGLEALGIRVSDLCGTVGTHSRVLQRMEHALSALEGRMELLEVKSAMRDAVVDIALGAIAWQLLRPGIVGLARAMRLRQLIGQPGATVATVVRPRAGSAIILFRCIAHVHKHQCCPTSFLVCKWAAQSTRAWLAVLIVQSARNALASVGLHSCVAPGDYIAAAVGAMKLALMPQRLSLGEAGVEDTVVDTHPTEERSREA